MIPGVTFHPRSSWEPADLRRDTSFHRTPPAAPRPGAVDRLATHYTGAVNIPDGDPNEILLGDDGIRRLLAAIHRDWLTNRTGGGYTRLSDGVRFPGYPFGYGFAIDWLGGLWEGTGFDYRDAATSGHSGHVLSVLMLTDRDDPGSELMWRTFRKLGRHARDERGYALHPEPWAHGWFREFTSTGTITACCGPALKGQIGQGLGNLDLDDMEDTMKPLPTPVRAYDSRPGAQAGVDPGLGKANEALPFTTLGDGKSRDVVVGLCTEAHVGVTVIGRTGNGYVSLNDPAGNTSLIGFSAGDRIETNGAPVSTPNGQVNVSVHDGTADVAVDVYARG